MLLENQNADYTTKLFELFIHDIVVDIKHQSIIHAHKQHFRGIFLLNALCIFIASTFHTHIKYSKLIILLHIKSKSPQVINLNKDLVPNVYGRFRNHCCLHSGF